VNTHGYSLPSLSCANIDRRSIEAYLGNRMFIPLIHCKTADTTSIECVYTSGSTRCRTPTLCEPSIATEYTSLPFFYQ